jgi:hypothetical protein
MVIDHTLLVCPLAYLDSMGEHRLFLPFHVEFGLLGVCKLFNRPDVGQVVNQESVSVVSFEHPVELSSLVGAVRLLHGADALTGLVLSEFQLNRRLLELFPQEFFPNSRRVDCFRELCFSTVVEVVVGEGQLGFY